MVGRHAADRRDAAPISRDRGDPELAAPARAKLPLLRDPDVSYYLRQERDGLLLGPYERRAEAGVAGRHPGGFRAPALRRRPRPARALHRGGLRPRADPGGAGVKRVVNGPIPYAPDGNPYIGPAHGLPQLLPLQHLQLRHRQAGGAGKALAEMDRRRRARMGPLGLRPAPLHRLRHERYTADKAVELYQHEYATAFPFEERPAGRPRRATPLYTAARGQGRPLRRARRLGAGGLFRSGRDGGRADPRASAGGATGSTRSGPRCGPCGRPSG